MHLLKLEVDISGERQLTLDASPVDSQSGGHQNLGKIHASETLAPRLTHKPNVEFWTTSTATANLNSQDGCTTDIREFPERADIQLLLIRWRSDGEIRKSTKEPSHMLSSSHILYRARERGHILEFAFI